MRLKRARFFWTMLEGFGERLFLDASQSMIKVVYHDDQHS